MIDKGMSFALSQVPKNEIGGLSLDFAERNEFVYRVRGIYVRARGTVYW